VSTSSTPEYRLMPFRLVLECDESRFQIVIAELANSVLPLEVREVRINPEMQSAGQGPQRGRDRGRPNAPAGGDVSSILHNSTIEIFGLAYLVNPPDPAKLKLTESTNGDAAAGATPANGATPAASTGTATTGTAATTTTTAPATAPATSTTGTTTPAAGTSTTTSASDAATGNATGNGAAGTSTTTTATPPADAAGK
jgi:hypothetical protein